MRKLTVILRQHTPLIHFQHYQDNATLRASEVKPQLDRFLLTRLGDGDYETGIERARIKEWLIGDGSHPALNYQMKISPMDDIEMMDTNSPQKRDGKYKMKKSRSHDNHEIISLNPYPAYFANMDADYKNPVEYKKFSMTDYLKMTFIFKNSTNAMVALSNFINDNSQLPKFFLRTNFGTRNSKGFGSFYIAEEDPLYVSPTQLTTYTFSVNAQSMPYKDICRGNEFEILFKVIETFYKSLRSGINEIDRQGNTMFYFKSIAYGYCTNILLKKWDKRKIKETFYNISTTTPEESCDIKDVFGFSTDEQWLSERDSIKKSIAIQVNGHWQQAPAANTAVPTRLQSPLLFKPIYDEDEDVYHIYLIFKEKEVKLEEFLSYRKVHISSREKHRSLIIDLPKEFQLQDFFSYFLDNSHFNINDHVEPQYHTHIYFDVLEDIYKQLKNI